MTKNFTTRGIRRPRTYNYAEAGKVINANQGTIRRWVKEEGLPLLMTAPQHLILGEDLLEFLKKKRAKQQVIVPAGCVLCFTCKKASVPLKEGRTLKPAATGAWLLCAECSNCGGRLRKTLSVDALPEFGFS